MHQKALAIIQDTLGELGEEPLELILKRNIQKNTGFEGETWLFDSLLEELEGFGPIKKLMDDLEISEILVNGPQCIFYEKNGSLHRFADNFASEVTLKRLVNRLLIRMEKTADVRHPLVDGVLGDETRVHVALPPVTRTPTLSIRRHVHRVWDLQNLVQNRMLTKDLAAKCENWVLNKKNILVCGPTGSGKTTLLRTLLRLVTPDERLVILEDTPEIGDLGPHAVRLTTREDPEGLAPSISLQTLLRHSLRMRPDRLVVGEVRGGEALTLLDALATGHRGSISTLHGHSADKALRRLESLVSRASPQWSIDIVRRLIADAIDIVISIEKQNGLRRVSQAVEITGFESFGFLLNPLL